MKRFHTFLTTAFLAGLSLPGYADDTELYLGQVVDIDRNTLPNVLYVLDRSGSMSEKDGGATTRLERMQDALLRLLDELENVNVGFMTFSGEKPLSGRDDDAVAPIRFPITYIDEPLANVPGEQVASSFKSEARISSSEDDVEEDMSSGNMLLGETILEATYRVGDISTVESQITVDADDAREFLTNEGAEPQGKVYATSNDWMALGGSSKGEVIVGLRFPSVEVPPNATIQNAEIVFYSQEDNSNSLNIQIHGVAADNPGSFQETNFYISSNYPMTTASVDWNNVEAWSGGSSYATQNMRTIVQEIVNRAGWTTSNAMAFRFARNPATYLPNNNRRFRTAGEGNGPLLRITYEVTSTAQKVGLRFQEVQIPQGATVTQARIDFISGPGESGTANFRIHGEDHDDSPAFTATKNDLSNRTLTSASVDWADIGAWTEDATYSSPDLIPIVQEIVNRSGWCGSNAMSFIISENGTDSLRKIKSYENSVNQVLHVEYDPDTVPAESCNKPLYSTQIASSSDDVEEFNPYSDGTNGTIGKTSSTLEMTTTNSGATVRTVGFRFPSIPIKQGATIVKAELILTAKESDSSTPVALEIRGELSTTAGVFTSTLNELSNRTKTTAMVEWTPSTVDQPLTAWTIGEQYTTPDLTSIVQEIVNQADWEAFNNMAFFVNGSGLRRAASFDHDPSQAAILRIQVDGTLEEKTVRHRLKELVSQITTNSYTPLVDAIYEAGQYYMGGAVVHGADRKQR